MKRFIVAAALAVALGFGTSGKANAQIVYGYSVPNAGGVVTNGTVVMPGAVRTFNNYYSPLTGVMTRQVYGQNFMGQTWGRSYGYSPLTGMSYNSGFYQPNYWINPYGGYSYGMVRRWGW